jgi:ABC-type Fe3+ transport system substrate-binding protein
MNPPRPRPADWSRREALRTFALGVVAAPLTGLLGACRRTSSTSAADADRSTVTVYCSLDRDIIEPVLKAAAAALTLNVEAVYDTEATKTTGLALRLRSEAARPRADLWLSSEAINTASLAAEATFDPLPSDSDPISPILARWPAAHRTPTWVQLALRARVLVHNPKALERSAARPPRSLLDFADPQLKGRVAIADPRFGTTRGQLALLHSTLSREGFELFLRALKSSEAQIVPGNAAVVRAVARGEAHAGITDIDDLRAAEREGWPVVESPPADASTTAPIVPPRPNLAALQALSDPDARALADASRISTPTTLAFVRASPNPQAASRLAAWLLDTHLETALAVPVWGAVSVDPKLRPTSTPITDPALNPDWSTLKDHIAPALQVWQQIMG